jgi:DNA-binding XRE family transcriptional regulator
MKYNLPISERIESHIISKENCWITDFSCSPSGYPLMGINRKNKLVSRVMYELHFGEIPPGMLVCHRCDNPKCVNPDHLFLGTYQDNIDDMMSKGRKASQQGSRNSQAKLNEEKVLEIKRDLAETNLTQEKIAKKYGVSDTIICQIKNGKIWNHVQPTHITNNNYYAPVTNVTNNNYSDAKQLSLFDIEEFE